MTAFRFVLCTAAASSLFITSVSALDVDVSLGGVVIGSNVDHTTTEGPTSNTLEENESVDVYQSDPEVRNTITVTEMTEERAEVTINIKKDVKLDGGQDSAIDINNGDEVTLNVENKADISSSGNAAIHVGEDSSLTVEGELNAETTGKGSAAIGGNSGEDAGIITSTGKVTATAGRGASGSGSSLESFKTALGFGSELLSQLERIVISDGTKIISAADGVRWAIDQDYADVSEVLSNILQGRFLPGILLPEENRVLILRDGELIESLTLPEYYRSYASTVSELGYYTTEVADTYHPNTIAYYDSYNDQTLTDLVKTAGI